jgi:DNA-binding Lrp family transcriptional regulator
MHTAERVYRVIATSTDKPLSYRSIAQRARVSVPTAIRYVKKFLGAGLITRECRRRSTGGDDAPIYRVLRPWPVASSRPKRVTCRDAIIRYFRDHARPGEYLRVSHKDLAQATGFSPETVRKTIAQMVEDGTLIRRHNFVIHDYGISQVENSYALSSNCHRAGDQNMRVINHPSPVNQAIRSMLPRSSNDSFQSIDTLYRSRRSVVEDKHLPAIREIQSALKAQLRLSDEELQQPALLRTLTRWLEKKSVTYVIEKIQAVAKYMRPRCPIAAFLWALENDFRPSVRQQNDQQPIPARRRAPAQHRRCTSSPQRIISEEEHYERYRAFYDLFPEERRLNAPDEHQHNHQPSRDPRYAAFYALFPDA